MFDFVGVHQAHEQIGGKRTQILFAARFEYDLATRVRHDRVIDLGSVRAGMKNLARELIGEGQVKAESTCLVEILGNRRCDEVLEFIDVNVKRLCLMTVRSLPAFLGCRPEVA